MGVKRIDDLVALQLAVALKREVYRIAREHPEVQRDWRFRDQLFGAALGAESNIAEGWSRYRAGEICQFLRFALASAREVERRLKDGVERGYYTPPTVAQALTLCNRTIGATTNLWKSLQPFVKKSNKPKQEKAGD